MSLIFEALKKLEREKQAPERGILVVGPTQWAGGGARVRLGVVVGGAVALVVLGVAIGVALRRAPVAAPAPHAPPAAAPAALAAPLAPPQAPAAAPAPVARLDLGPAASVQPAPPARQTAPAPALRAVAPPPAVPPTAVETPEPEPAGSEGPSLTLQAVTEQDGVAVALINDRLMRVGDAYDGVKVLAITPGAVEVEVEATGERRTLTF